MWNNFSPEQQDELVRMSVECCAHHHFTKQVTMDILHDAFQVNTVETARVWNQLKEDNPDYFFNYDERSSKLSGRCESRPSTCSIKNIQFWGSYMGYVSRAEGPIFSENGNYIKSSRAYLQLVRQRTDDQVLAETGTGGETNRNQMWMWNLLLQQRLGSQRMNGQISERGSSEEDQASD